MISDRYDSAGIIKFFEEISAIPHGSGNEKAISDYLVAFAKERGLWVMQDAALNVIIKKNGSQGYETEEPVIIQGHMDMVCEKNADSPHDFLNDGIKLVAEGDYIKANGTTLGADNGIAVAMAMALLDSDKLSHPPLEVFITTNEETGMDGAKAMNASLFEAKRLINLDNEEDTMFFVSCAGGARCDLSFKIDFEQTKSNKSAYNVCIAGLKGGHSGSSIHLGRCNSIRLISAILSELGNDFAINLFHIEGGSKENAIPREASFSIVIDENSEDSFKSKIEEISRVYRELYSTVDPGLTIDVKKTDIPEQVFSAGVTQNIISAGILLPNGVGTMSSHIPGLVESSANIGIVRTNDKSVSFCCSLRSSVLCLKQAYYRQIGQIARLTGAGFGLYGEYPAWEFNPHSPLRDLFLKTYKELFSEEAKISAIHAGLECGVFYEKIPGLDMISIGPNMYDVHTPDESLSISSTLRVWELLTTVLANMKQA